MIMNTKLWRKTLIFLMAIEILLASCSTPSAPRQVENRTSEPAETNSQKSSFPTTSTTLGTLLTKTDTPIPMTDIPVVVTNEPLPPKTTPSLFTDKPTQVTLIPHDQLSVTNEPSDTPTTQSVLNPDNSALLDSLQNQLAFAFGGGGEGSAAAQCSVALDAYAGTTPTSFLGDRAIANYRSGSLCLFGLNMENILQVAISDMDGKTLSKGTFKIGQEIEGGMQLDQTQPVEIAGAGELVGQPGKVDLLQLNIWIPPYVNGKTVQIEAQSDFGRIKGQVLLTWPENEPVLFLKYPDYNPFAQPNQIYDGVVGQSDLATLSPRNKIDVYGMHLPANQPLTLAMYQRRRTGYPWSGRAELVNAVTVSSDSRGELDYQLSIEAWIPPGLYHLTAITNPGETTPYAGPFIGVYADTCPGATDSNLLEGDTVILNLDMIAPMDLRSEPGGSEKIVGNMQPDETAQIVDDFRCVDQMVWWKVRTSNGVEGWTAEGQGNEQYIVPAE
jgi:hypothetical protein